MGASKEAIDPGTDWFAWTHSPRIIGEHLVSEDLPEQGDGFWNLYKEDLQRAADLGTNSIRLGAEWSRIFPSSTESVGAKVKRNNRGVIVAVEVDERGFRELSEQADQKVVKHYRSIFRCAKSAGLGVFLTLSHFTLPLWVHDPIACHEDVKKASRKGWVDENTVIEFGKYADFAARVFSRDVDIWETLNEPEVVATEGYALGRDSGFPPALRDRSLAFRVERNFALAHNVAYKNVKRHNASSPVGIGVAPNVFVPADEDPRSRLAAEHANYMNVEWVLNAIVHGAFDNDFDMVTDELVEGVGGTDFIGVDYYNRIRMRYRKGAIRAWDTSMETLPCVDCSDFGWDIYPEGIRIATNWVYHKYRLPIYVLENGIADAKDEKRGRYIREHLRELLKAVVIDQVPVRGYYHWSLLDNFEWAQGYKMRFGLYAVDFKTKERRMRESAETFREICRTGEV
jgi:beta-galactosidase